ncbi:hypothetical protein MNBD_GAMMA11-3052 [hydrothermal vent metagenome]|uniref:Pilus assembly protein n=1 Tax=hydrothermal vent metagenome TaxID=652676 RepID=A0A3B0WRV8_9ZZZZ
MIAKLKASAIHFCISGGVIALFLSAVFYVWYPWPFYELYSTWDVIKIVVSVDLVLGPLLTLVVFNKAKKPAELKRDLSIIVLFQLSALAWGVHITYSARPVFLVFSNGSFYSFAKTEVDVSQLKYKELEPAFYHRPAMAYLTPPKDKDELWQIINDMADNGSPGLIYRASRYQPISDYWQKIYRFPLDIDELKKKPESAELIENFIKRKKDGLLENYVFYPMRSGRASATLVINKNTNKIDGFIDKML